MKTNIRFFQCVMKVSIVLSAIFLAGVCLSAAYANSFNPQSFPLLHPENLIYQGAFKLPAGTIGGSSFNYGGGAVLAYNPQNNSLLIVGHDNHQMVAEINIPAPIVSSEEANLPTAALIQPFADPSEGKIFTIDDSLQNKAGGLLVFNNRLYGSAFSWFDVNHSQILSHYVSSLDFSNVKASQGMFQLGETGAGFVSGYMTLIPEEWREALGGPALTGNCCIPIIARSSLGPAAFTFNPLDVGTKSPIPAIPLVYYPHSNPLGEWSSTNPYFNGSTRIKGLVLPPSSRSLLFIGRHGQGTWCYGIGGAEGECPDPTNSNKANHAYPYANQVWAYDVLDLIQAKNGALNPWEVKPYKIWNFTLPFESEGYGPVLGVSNDPSTQRIFIAHDRGSKPPIIHVFKSNHVSTWEDSSPPTSPKNLVIMP